MNENQLHGITVKEKNDKRIAIGIHRDGLVNILSQFGIPEDIKEQVRQSASDWANISIVRRDQKHPAGYTHFAIAELKRRGHGA